MSSEAASAAVSMATLLAFVGLTACAPLSHIDPQPRTDIQAARATVAVSVNCSSADPFGSRVTTSWFAHTATGTLIAGAFILSAAHAFPPCSEIPRITVWDGRRPHRAWIDRQGDDIVRLEMLDAVSGIAPPELGDSDGLHYVMTTTRGVFTGARRDLAALGRPGDSGAGVYSSSGLLVGLLLGTDDYGGIRIARVDANWLEGI